MSTIEREAVAHFDLAARESQPLADVVLPGTADFRSQTATELGMRYVFGEGALAYTDSALTAYCASEPDVRALVERHSTGVAVVIYWS